MKAGDDTRLHSRRALLAGALGVLLRLTVPFLLGLTAAQAASVKEVFEKHGLLGTWALDCSKPASRSNYYYVHRLLDADRLQREAMEGPQSRAFLAVIDRAAEKGPNELAVSGTVDGKPFSSIYRVEPARMRVLKSTIDGKVVITGGRFVNGSEFPWADKCSAPGQPAQAQTPGPATSAVERMQVNGQTRTYLLHRPAAPGPRPTIIMLHGFNGTGANIARQSGLDRLAPQSGLVAVFPDRLPQLQGWNFFPPGKEPPMLLERTRAVGGAPDDVGFLKGLVAELVRRGIADPKRIYLAGLSNGSFMTLRMICADAGMLAAVALLVGGMPELLGADCRPAKPVAALMINGTADRVVPYAGGMVQPGNAFPAWSTERLVEFFRRLDGCSADAEQSVLPSASPHKVEAAHWTSCGGASVVFYRVVGAGHDAASALNVGQLLLDFFRDKTR